MNRLAGTQAYKRHFGEEGADVFAPSLAFMLHLFRGAALTCAEGLGVLRVVVLWLSPCGALTRSVKYTDT